MIECPSDILGTCFDLFDNLKVYKRILLKNFFSHVIKVLLDSSQLLACSYLALTVLTQSYGSSIMISRELRCGPTRKPTHMIAIYQLNISKFMLQKLLQKSFIFIYKMKTITAKNSSTLSFYLTAITFALIIPNLASQLNFFLSIINSLSVWQARSKEKLHQVTSQLI